MTSTDASGLIVSTLIVTESIFTRVSDDPRKPIPDAVQLHDVTRAAVYHDLRDACIAGRTWLLRIDAVDFGLIDSLD